MRTILFICYISVCVILLNYQNHFSQINSEGDPLPSIAPPNDTEVLGKIIDHETTQPYFNPSLQKVDRSFEGFWFQDNPTENFGFRFIPPDPIGAAGKGLLIAVVNSMIEARNKGGLLKWREGLFDFYASLFSGPFESPDQLPFDPKIVYDHYRDRFVVVALEQATGTLSVDPNNISRILLAVSKNGNPKNASDWYFQAINAKQIVFGAFEGWADYPGLEIDEEAIYITANIFTFVPFGFYGGSRLWIADKALYNGAASTVNVYDPYAADGIATTTMPAMVHGNEGAGPGIGTYLVSYSGLTDGVDEYVQVVRIDDPLGSPSFNQEFILLGNIEGPFAALIDAPQLGSAIGIEVNDRRALDACVRNNELWMVTTISPNFGTEVGQTTAYWVQLDVSVPGATTVIDRGVIDGEDIAATTFTFFPSVAINRDGIAKIGFSASAPTIYAGAYVTGRTNTDPAGTVRGSEVVHEGLAPYVRTFGGPRNRWGDYSGISVDPTNDDFVWVFNEYAAEPGSPTTVPPQGPEDGRWGTAWARCRFVGTEKPIIVSESMPEVFALNQNYPNPFNPTTTIKFDLPKTSEISLIVYNAMGQIVKTLASGDLEAGYHSYIWDGTNSNGLKVSSGIYLYKLIAGNSIQSNKMILLK